MAEKILNKLKKVFKEKEVKKEDLKDKPIKYNVKTMEKYYAADDLVQAAKILKKILEIYGIQKKENHRLKGREFVHFILSSKHKDLKNLGYKHWQNINKIIYLNQSTVYPYHKKNLRKAMDFYEKELKSIHLIDK